MRDECREGNAVAGRVAVRSVVAARVHDLLAAVIDRHGSAAGSWSAIELLLECFGNCPEVGVDLSFDHPDRASSQARSESYKPTIGDASACGGRRRDVRTEWSDSVFENMPTGVGMTLPKYGQTLVKQGFE